MNLVMRIENGARCSFKSGWCGGISSCLDVQRALLAILHCNVATSMSEKHQDSTDNGALSYFVSADIDDLAMAVLPHLQPLLMCISWIEPALCKSRVACKSFLHMKP